MFRKDKEKENWLLEKSSKVFLIESEIVFWERLLKETVYMRERNEILLTITKLEDEQREVKKSRMCIK